MTISSLVIVFFCFLSMCPEVDDNELALIVLFFCSLFVHLQKMTMN
jgi:hypothetical protein